MIWDNNEDIRLIECANKSRTIQNYLNECREERRPYVFITNTMTIKPLRRILVPVSMLEEETYKAEICTYLARKTGAHIILLQANDYGSHARQNVNRIVTHIKAVNERMKTEEVRSQNSEVRDQMSEVRSQNSEVRSQNSEVRSQNSEVRDQMSEVRIQNSEFRDQMSEVRSQKSEVRDQMSEVRSQNSEFRDQMSEVRSQNSEISYEVCMARKDSFSLVREASERQRDFQHDLLILTASRDYGLDDILFGPPERKAIQRALVPVMLVNPREDLFSLCD